LGVTRHRIDCQASNNTLINDISWGFKNIISLLALPAFFAAGALMIMKLGASPQTTSPPESM
jgi:hypothetical protein